MAFLRRRGPEPVTEIVEPLPPAADSPVAENCPYCHGEVVQDADHPADLLVAMLVERPGHPPYLVAHRACAERAVGHRILS
jgi:hypothetical protein